jgi:hypothetical protein
VACLDGLSSSRTATAHLIALSIVLWDVVAPSSMTVRDILSHRSLTLLLQHTAIGFGVSSPEAEVPR